MRSNLLQIHYLTGRDAPQVVSVFFDPLGGILECCTSFEGSQIFPKEYTSPMRDHARIATVHLEFDYFIGPKLGANESPP